MWGYIIAGIAALAAIATITVEVKSYLGEVKESGRVEVREQWQAASQKRRERETLASTTAASGLASDRANSKNQTKTRTEYVEKIIEKPIYSNICLDAAGLSCLNASLGRKGSAGCKPDGVMPRPAITLRWDWGSSIARLP